MTMRPHRRYVSRADERAERLAKVAKLLIVGCSHNVIAERLGVSRQRVAQLAREAREAGLVDALAPRKVAG